jgi:diguanylate cyclase (GGDEF)-like protein
MTDHSLVQQLSVLQQHYRQRLQHELPRLSEALQAAEHRNDAADAYRQLLNQFHNIAGAAGTFGMHDVGRMARDIEQLLQQKLHQLPPQHSRGRSPHDDHRPSTARTPAHDASSHSADRLGSQIDTTMTSTSPHALTTTIWQYFQQLCALATADITTNGSASHMPVSPVATSLTLQTGEHSTLAPAERQHRSQPDASHTHHPRGSAKASPIPLASKLWQPGFERHDRAAVIIYLLEDDSATAQHLCLTLATFGYQVQWFHQSHALEVALQQQEPDLVIIDIQLPNETEDGLVFLQRMQELRERPLPVFVLTSYDDFSHYLHAIRAGAIGYFVKPLNTSALESRLQRLLAQRQRDAFRVLIVDDDALLAEHYARVLRRAGLIAEILTQPQDIFTALQRLHPDVILVDVNMPGCTGPELAQVVRLQDEWLGVPIIYLSAETDSEKQLEVLVKAGDDFLTKPITDNALVVAIFARVQRARQLAEVMTRDSLTGLLQHAHIKERLASELQRSLRTEQPVAVVMLDIDHFKKVNDTYGHLCGDQVIKSLAALLQQQLRKTDFIGRYGGEEFLLVLPDCPLAQAYHVIEQLREAFAGYPFMVNHSSPSAISLHDQGQHIAVNTPFYATFSAGISMAAGSVDVDMVIEQADQALYQAKANGRNQVLLASQFASL